MLTRELADGTDLLRLQSSDPARYPLLLESVAGGNALSRWDLLLVADGDGLRLDAGGHTQRLDGRPADGDFLQALDADWRALQTPRTDGGLPFRGGWALFLAYELAGQVESSLRLPQAPGPLPVAVALRCPAAVLRDRDSGRCVAVAEDGAASLLDAIAPSPAPDDRPPFAPPALHEDQPQRFLDGVERIHRYLRAGDVFQVNLSRAWRAQFEHAPDPAAVYAQLRLANPAPFAGLLRLGDAALMSSSPERLVSVRGTRVETRPIAGTRPRFPGDDEAARIRDLVGNPKERAEHVMLIDLERNDLGRVCVPGSVRVDELMTVESYAHVHHIVSNVGGELRPGTTPGDVIRAVFPGGTITGAPKVRCMQIIAELEGEGRGAYTGALGYLGRDGDLDLNILIRSAWLAGRELQFRTGAGIVVDSDAARELDETRAKARGLLRALGSGRVSALATLLFRGTRRVEALDPADRGLAYGDGLFETALVHDGLVVWWPAHLARLSEGAARLRIPMPDVAWLTSQLATFVARAPGRAVLKLVLTRGVGGRGYAPPETVEPTLALSLHAAPARAAAPLALRWCDTRLAIQPALAGLKHLNRLEQVLARAEWSDPAVHEGLMLDADGLLGCATAANVFALRDGRWLTPPVHRRGVAGVARAWVLANEPASAEAELSRDQVESADALFLCNAVRGILPVGRLGDRSWAPHPALAALQRRLGRSEPAFDPGS